MLIQSLDKFEILKRSLSSLEVFQKDVLVSEFDSSLPGIEGREWYASVPSRHDALINIGISEGELEISVDYITYQIPKNGVVWILPTHIAQVISVVSDTKGWIMLVSREFMAENSTFKNNTSLISYMQLKKNPYTVFEAHEFQILYENLLVVRAKIKQKTHLFHKEVIANAVNAFMLDMANCFLGKKENMYVPAVSRKEKLVTDFFALLSQHCKKQHDVAFYAEKLCITPQYLSLSLRRQSGLSTIQWIHNALMVEAKGLLKSPHVSVQQVAEELNFPDQSTFGKFFKKNTGLSPIAFRKT